MTCLARGTVISTIRVRNNVGMTKLSSQASPYTPANAAVLLGSFQLRSRTTCLKKAITPTPMVM